MGVVNTDLTDWSNFFFPLIALLLPLLPPRLVLPPLLGGDGGGGGEGDCTRPAVVDLLGVFLK